MGTTVQLLRLAHDVRLDATDGDLLLRYSRDRDEVAFAEIVMGGPAQQLPADSSSSNT